MLPLRGSLRGLLTFAAGFLALLKEARKHFLTTRDNMHSDSATVARAMVVPPAFHRMLLHTGLVSTFPIAALSGLTELSASCATLDPDRAASALVSAVRTAWPATRPAHSFLKFRAYPLNVLPSGFRFLDGDNPADPLIAREWRNILPFCPRRRVRKENSS